MNYGVMIKIKKNIEIIQIKVDLQWTDAFLGIAMTVHKLKFENALKAFSQ